MKGFRDGRAWMWVWVGFGLVVLAQTVWLWLAGSLNSTGAISLMSVEALFGSMGSGFQATLSMRKADPGDPL